MTVTVKKKISKKNIPVFKTKITKKKVLGLQKDKVMKKRKNGGKKKKAKDDSKKVKEVSEQVVVMKKKNNLQMEEKRTGEEHMICAKKKTTKRKKGTKDAQKGKEMVIEEQTLEERDSSACEEEEMATEEGHSETHVDNDENDDTKELNGSSDDEDEEDTEAEEDEGYEESFGKDVPKPNLSPHATEKSKMNKHMVFDEDETFENLPALTSVVATVTPEEEEEEESDSDSDAPPEEETISMGKDIFEDDDKKMKSELVKLKNQVKEARRLKHEKNREQQLKKRQRLQKLEKSRLPTDLLDAVATERAEPKKISIPEQKSKRKTFDDILSDDLFTEAVDDDELITLTQGVKVRAVQQEAKKHASVASIAAEFRQKAFYNSKVPRMSSLAHRQMDVKRQKSGKNVIVS